MSRIAFPAIEFSRSAVTDICVQVRKVIHGGVANADVTFSYLDPVSVGLVYTDTQWMRSDNYRAHSAHKNVHQY
ncbi:hypothetical protein [Pseudomonas sp. URMO17WK12:I12]|uniref:hypothetical protein n=1 Tax=Pseudomonas sp. URMO17WK12:I12 TaxID=1259797 RepID=UPI0004810319|nr:hypothetical protein [Pseudomonas sp. URMO17WK12:I12]